MDPISIITAAASLAGAVFAASLKIKDTFDELDNAPQNVCDIAEEIYAVKYALTQVEDVVRRDPNVIDRLALEDVFALAVKGCHAILMSIHKEYEQLFARKDWKAKFMVIWKDSEMTRLLDRLDRKKATLTLLTQTLNLRSTQDIKDLLLQNQSTLIAASQDKTDEVVHSSELQARYSSEETLVNDLHADNESVLSTTEFDFDFDLINTRTYRRALARAQTASKISKPASINVDKPLPQIMAEKSPVSSESGQTEVSDIATSPVNLPGTQPSLSRATTLLPETEGIELGVLNSALAGASYNEGLQSTEQIDVPARLDSKSGSKVAVSVLQEEPQGERDSKHPYRKRPHKHKSRNRLQSGESTEKPHRRRIHGKPPLPKPFADFTSRHAASQLECGTEAMKQTSEEMVQTNSNDAEGEGDASKYRHKGGCKHDSRHRLRANRSGSKENDEGASALLSKALKGRHPRGVHRAVGMVEDSMRHLSITDSVPLRSENGRRRQAV
ncbi:uncharacterized protein CTRU02_202601 [Colletotrichum truncatum]|uniref:Uncharacterized protein n=1 Tax=Colletotrichum truncatum TaxID=5467 RepID=A0ACC3ZKQ4_COLTU|nr:uncharacterized protein CTRU02_01770 [Colletotrichum truncatum]KAF6800091.1 hypothetical protein CTRU02_01770 [Colletotrichum truncatum]